MAIRGGFRGGRNLALALRRFAEGFAFRNANLES